MGACAGAHAPFLLRKLPVGRDDSARGSGSVRRLGRAGVVAPYTGTLNKAVIKKRGTVNCQIIVWKCVML
jgi:hypothetical protein